MLEYFETLSITHSKPEFSVQFRKHFVDVQDSTVDSLFITPRGSTQTPFSVKSPPFMEALRECRAAVMVSSYVVSMVTGKINLKRLPCVPHSGSPRRVRIGGDGATRDADPTMRREHLTETALNRLNPDGPWDPKRHPWNNGSREIKLRHLSMAWAALTNSITVARQTFLSGYVTKV